MRGVSRFFLPSFRGGGGTLPLKGPPGNPERILVIEIVHWVFENPVTFTIFMGGSRPRPYIKGQNYNIKAAVYVVHGGWSTICTQRTITTLT